MEEIGDPYQGAACRKRELEKAAITEHAWHHHHPMKRFACEGAAAHQFHT